LNTAYLLLGSNEGNRAQQLQEATDMIVSRAGVLHSCSALYETAAWGRTDQPDFLNAAICIRTSLDATQLLLLIQDIEAVFGRQRTVVWGQRTLDIDILFFNDEVISLPELQVPHPHLQNRRFVLTPLAEIAAALRHPVLHQSVAELLQQCPDTLEVRPAGHLRQHQP